MSLEQITAVCIGMTINAATFVLGVLVGCSLRRKEASHDSDSGTEADEAKHWHGVARR